MPGSFNPFTIGHADVLERALAIFDSVVVAVGFNFSKPEDAASAEKRANDIACLYSSDNRVEVVAWGGLTADLVRQTGAAAIVRGVRDVRDFEYERNLADANRALAGVETILLPCRPELGWVSSSLVRELRHFGKETESLLPRKQ